MPVPEYQITVTLMLDQHWHEELEKRFTEAQQKYPQVTMEQFIAWAVRYYLQHAYNEQGEEEEPECECGTTIKWLVSFFGEDYQGSHISDCSDCGQHTLHISDESARCVYPGCGYSSGVDAEGNHYVRGEIVSNGGKSIDQLRNEYFDGYLFMVG